MASSPNLAMQLYTPRVVLEAVRGTPGVAGGGGGGGGWAGSSHQTSTAYWDFFYDLIANPTVASGWGRACVFDAAGRAAKTAELTGHWASHGVGMYSLHARDGAALGYCRLRVVEEGVELLYALAPPHWGKGLCTEAAGAVVAAARAAGIPCLVATTLPGAASAASQVVLGKLGFERTPSRDTAGQPTLWWWGLEL